MFVERDIRAVLVDDADVGELEQPATSDEIALEKKDLVIPYPNEHNMQLGLEVMNVFGAEVVITTTVGSGELFKAVLQKHKFGVGICKTATQKKQVMIKLKHFAKLMNLVSFKDAPAKSDELLKYEKHLVQKKADPATPLPKAPPADPATPKAPPAGLPIVSTPPCLAGFGASAL